MSEQSHQSRPGWWQQNQLRLAVFMTTLAAVSANVQLSLQPGEKVLVEVPVPAEVVPSIPSPEIFTDSDRSELDQETTNDYKAGGFSAAIIPPNPTSQSNFASFYANDKGLPSADPPPLKEVVLLSDRKAFSREDSAYPGFAPLEVFNTTDEPVDIPFMRATAVALRAWQASYAHRQLPLYGGAVEANIKPHVEDHVDVQVANMPPRVKDPANVGETFYPGPVVSWIRPAVAAQPGPYDLGAMDLPENSPYDPAAYAKRAVVAVEMCQSLVWVDKAKATIGSGYIANTAKHLMDASIQTYKHSLVDTVQENVCNALGRTLAALYLGGPQEVNAVQSTWGPAGLAQIPGLDFSPYTPWLSTFARIDRAVEDHPGVIESIDGHSTPTSDYYSSYLVQP